MLTPNQLNLEESTTQGWPTFSRKLFHRLVSGTFLLLIHPQLSLTTRAHIVNALNMASKPTILKLRIKKQASPCSPNTNPDHSKERLQRTRIQRNGRKALHPHGEDLPRRRAHGEEAAQHFAGPGSAHEPLLRLWVQGTQNGTLVNGED